MTMPFPSSTESTPTSRGAAPAVPPRTAAAAIEQAKRMGLRMTPSQVSRFGVSPASKPCKETVRLASARPGARRFPASPVTEISDFGARRPPRLCWRLPRRARHAGCRPDLASQRRALPRRVESARGASGAVARRPVHRDRRADRRRRAHRHPLRRRTPHRRWRAFGARRGPILALGVVGTFVTAGLVSLAGALPPRHSRGSPRG